VNSLAVGVLTQTHQKVELNSYSNGYIPIAGYSKFVTLNLSIYSCCNQQVSLPAIVWYLCEEISNCLWHLLFVVVFTNDLTGFFVV